MTFTLTGTLSQFGGAAADVTTVDVRVNTTSGLLKDPIGTTIFTSGPVPLTSPGQINLVLPAPATVGELWYTVTWEDPTLGPQTVPFPAPTSGMVDLHDLFEVNPVPPPAVPTLRADVDSIEALLGAGTPGQVFTTTPSGPTWQAPQPGGAVSSVNGQTGTVVLARADVGLGQVDNTSDVNKPVSIAQGAADAAVQAAAAADATTKASAAQAFAIQRGNHTGTQTASTISDFAPAVDARVAAGITGKADLIAGKLNPAQVPDIAIVDYLGSSANQTAMLAKTGQKGDWTIRADSGTVWIITGTDPTQLTSWTQVAYPAAPVSSVAGRTGAVALTTADIGGLAGVASSGSYADLLGRPVFGTAAFQPTTAFDPAGAAASAVSVAVMKTANPVNVKDQANPLANAIMDGASHPLSTRFASLAAAQAVFPAATSLTDEIDYWAIQVNLVDGAYVRLPAGTARLQGALVVPNGMTTGLVIEGMGKGVTILKLRDTASGAQTNNSVLVDQAMATANFNANNATSAAISNGLALLRFTIDGNKANVGTSYVAGQSFGVGVNAMGNFTVRDVEVRNVAGWGFRCTGTTAGYTETSWIHGLWAHDNAYHGIYVGYRYRKCHITGMTSTNNGTNGTCGSTKGGTQIVNLAGVFLDCSEMQVTGLQAHGNNGDGVIIRNVMACQYDDIKATGNGGAGIHVMGMVSSTGTSWLAVNNGTNPGNGQNNSAAAGVVGDGVSGGGSGTKTGAPDIWLDDTAYGGATTYGVSQNTRITGVVCGINPASSGTWPGVESTGIYADDGMAGQDVVFRNVSLNGSAVRVPANPGLLQLTDGLSSLSDVSKTAPVDGQTMVYNGTTKLWTPATVSATVAPDFTMASGSWWQPNNASLSTANLALNTPVLFPIRTPHAMTIQSLMLEVTTAGAAGAVVRLGFYRQSSAGLPDLTQLIADCGTIDATTTGIKSITGLSAALPNGIVWVMGVAQGATSSVRACSAGAPIAFPYPGGFTPAGGAAQSTLGTSATVSGSLPTSGSLTVLSQNPLRVFLRTA